MPPIFRARVQVAAGLRLGCRGMRYALHDRVVEPGADQTRRNLRKSERRSSDSAQAECRAHAAPVAVDRDLGRGRDHREVAVAHGDFIESGTRVSPRPCRPMDFLEALAGTNVRRHRTGEELFGFERAHAAA